MELVRALRELVVALDRRVPRAGQQGEAAIARDAAALRATAVQRLDELTVRTPFPVTPGDVAALTIDEFAVDLDVNQAPSLDDVCRRFVGDTNRALVWLIRFRALQVWCARAEIGEWLRSGSNHSQEAYKAAASFRLNADWEFDAGAFRSEVESHRGASRTPAK
jgi:hypothetical protein